MRIALALLFTAILAAAGVVGAAIWEPLYFASPGPALARTVVVINPHSGALAIAERLSGAGVVRSGIAFQAAVMLRGKSAQLKAGEYGFPAHASEATIMDMIVMHKVIEHRRGAGHSGRDSAARDLSFRIGNVAYTNSRAHAQGAN
jgi:UPF0755 protein